MADTSNLSQFLTDVADAIRTKKETTEQIPAENFDQEILSIETGIDTSDATATTDDILFPETAYVNGKKVTGNINTKIEYLDVTSTLSSYSSSLKTLPDVTNDKGHYITVSPSGDYIIVFAFCYNSGDWGRIVIYNTSGTLIAQSDKITGLGSNAWTQCICGNETSEYIDIAVKEKSTKLYRYYKSSKTFTNIPNSIISALSSGIVLMAISTNSPKMIWLNGNTLKILKISASGLSLLQTETISKYTINTSNALLRYIGDNFSISSSTGSVIGVLGDENYTITNVSGYATIIGSMYLNRGNLYDINTNELLQSGLVTGQSFTDMEYTKLFVISSIPSTPASPSNMSVYNIVDKSLVFDSTIKFYNISNSTNHQVRYSINIYNIPTSEKHAYLAMNSLSSIIGYNIEYSGETVITELSRKNITYYYPINADISNSDVLKSKVAYGNNGKIIGNMPNNGELNYIPSSEEQIIPAGYTSGGIISAMDITTSDEYSECLELTENILNGITIDTILPTEYLLLNLTGSKNTGDSFDTSIAYWNNLATNENISILNGTWENNTLILNGSNTEFDTGIAQSELSNGYTIVLRIKPTRWSNDNGIYGLHYSANNGICGLQYHDGEITYQHYNNGKISLTTTQLPINNWHIITIRYNAENSLVQIYINKSLISSKAMLLKPNGNLIVGRAGNLTDASRYFKGNISHFIVYNGTLTDIDLNNLYTYIENTI